jgi:hypothetical protein
MGLDVSRATHFLLGRCTVRAEFFSRVNVSGPNIFLLAKRRIFLFVGLVTVVSVPFTLSNSKSAWVHTKPVLRLRGSNGPNIAMWLLNVGASVTNTLGLLILTGWGSDKYST